MTRATRRRPPPGGFRAAAWEGTIQILRVTKMLFKIASPVKSILIHGFCRDLVSHRLVTLAFRRFDWLRGV